MIRLAHDEEREVLPDGLSEPLDEVLRRDPQLEPRAALSVGLLLEPIPGNGREGSGLAVGQAQGHCEVRVAIIVQGDDLLAALREDTCERSCDGGLAGAAFSADRDFHRGGVGYRIAIDIAREPGRVVKLACARDAKDNCVFLRILHERATTCELEGEHCFPSETQQRDRSGQLLEICGLGNVGLESGPQGIEPVFGGRAARESYRRSVAATLR